MSRRYFVLDVFTGEALSGNPLAVVLETDDLDEARMQAIARELNLSETVFVRPAVEAPHRAALRIFTPKRELPFAGHPTVGTAALLTLRSGEARAAFELEEKIGPIACVVERRGERMAVARFRAPRLPERVEPAPDAAAVAAGIGLGVRDLARAPEVWSAGVAFPCVTLRTVDALARAHPQPGLTEDHVYLYVATGRRRIRARMFAPGLGVVEDPATGSAAAAFAGLLHAREEPSDGSYDVTIEQGVEMGRPSRIELRLVVRDAALAAVEIGGEVVVVAEGVLHV
jgi:trans-2,3-dihydro-3-hydroxyanthranilate isomerase